MKKLLITGIGGFAGSHMLDHFLVNTDWEIHGIDSFSHKGVSERIIDSEIYQQNKERVRIHLHNLAAPFSKQLKNRLGDIDCIIQNASGSHVDRSIDDPVPFIKNNIDLMLNVLEYAREVEPEILSIISTDEVYGAAIGEERHAEWSIIKPSNPYSASKAAQEAIAISYWRTYGTPVVLTNTMNLIGERQDPEKFIPKVIKSVLAEEEVTIHGSPDNIGSRFYLHCRNQADAQLFILKNLKPSFYPEAEMPDRYNIVGEREINNLEMAKMIAKIIGKPLNYKWEDFHKTRPGHDKRYALDGSKLCDLGWKPPMSFDESLKKTVEWTLRNKEWLL